MGRLCTWHRLDGLSPNIEKWYDVKVHLVGCAAVSELLKECSMSLAWSRILYYHTANKCHEDGDTLNVQTVSH